MGRDERSNLRGMPGGLPIIGAGGGRILSTPPEVLDARGRVLQVGDEVILTHGGIQPFVVTGIEPTPPDADLPAGLMDMVLTCRMLFRAPRSQPNAEFVRTQTQSETGFMQKDKGGVQGVVE